jgi:hypothetical protein
MARTIQEIYDEILLEKAATPELDIYNSPSSVAYWRLISWVIAVSIWSLEKILDIFKADLEQIAREAVPGTPDWLQKRALEFQYSANPGEEQVLQIIDGRATYPIIITEFRIVTRAAVKELTNSRVALKIAKDDGAGSLTKLATIEEAAFTDYIKKIGFAGIPINVVNLLPDRLKVELTILYDGQYVLTNVQNNVKEAISNYLETVSVVNFNGTLVREDFINAILVVPGVKRVDSYNMVLKARHKSQQ